MRINLHDLGSPPARLLDSPNIGSRSQWGIRCGMQSHKIGWSRYRLGISTVAVDSEQAALHYGLTWPMGSSYCDCSFKGHQQSLTQLWWQVRLGCASRLWNSLLIIQLSKGSLAVTWWNLGKHTHYTEPSWQSQLKPNYLLKIPGTRFTKGYELIIEILQKVFIIIKVDPH